MANKVSLSLVCNEQTKHSFVDDQYNPDGDHESRFLKTRVIHNLLWLSEDEQALEAGVIDQTDRLSEDIKVSHLLVRHGGKTNVLKLEGDCQPSFGATSDNGPTAERSLHGNVTLLESNGDQARIISVTGTANLNHGTLDLDAFYLDESCNPGDYEILGFRVDAYRVNDNRR